jgi:hypothetical protein
MINFYIIFNDLIKFYVSTPQDLTPLHCVYFRILCRENFAKTDTLREELVVKYAY